MRGLFLILLGIALFGCNDGSIPREVYEGFGDSARADIAINHRLKAIEEKLGIVPPIEDIEGLDEMERAINEIRARQPGR